MKNTENISIEKHIICPECGSNKFLKQEISYSDECYGYDRGYMYTCNKCFIKSYDTIFAAWYDTSEDYRLYNAKYYVSDDCRDGISEDEHIRWTMHDIEDVGELYLEWLFKRKNRKEYSQLVKSLRDIHLYYMPDKEKLEFIISKNQKQLQRYSFNKISDFICWINEGCDITGKVDVDVYDILMDTLYQAWDEFITCIYITSALDYNKIQKFKQYLELIECNRGEI